MRGTRPSVALTPLHPHGNYAPEHKLSKIKLPAGADSDSVDICIGISGFGVERRHSVCHPSAIPALRERVEVRK